MSNLEFESFRSSNFNFGKRQSINSRNIPGPRISWFFLEKSRYVAIWDFQLCRNPTASNPDFDWLRITTSNIRNCRASPLDKSVSDDCRILDRQSFPPLLFFVSICVSHFSTLFLIHFELWRRKLIILKWAKLIVHYKWTWAMVSSVFVKDRHTPKYRKNMGGTTFEKWWRKWKKSDLQHRNEKGQKYMVERPLRWASVFPPFPAKKSDQTGKTSGKKNVSVTQSYNDKLNGRGRRLVSWPRGVIAKGIPIYFLLLLLF